MTLKQELTMKRPNMLFMHVDQRHWEAMSGYGIVPTHYLVDAQGRAQLVTITRSGEVIHQHAATE